MAIPPDRSMSILQRWLAEAPAIPPSASRVAPTLTPVQQRAIQQATIALIHNILREAPPQPGAAALPARVAQVDNLYIAQQLVPFLLPQLGQVEGGLPVPPPGAGDTEAPDGGPVPRAPSGAVGPGATLPVMQNEVLLLLLSTFRQLLDQPMLLWELTQAQNNAANRVAPDRKDAVPIPRGQSHTMPSQGTINAQTAIISQLTKQAERAALRLSTQNMAEPRSISGRTSSHQPQAAARSSDEWVFRLLGIQAAVRNMGATPSGPLTTTSSAEMALAMSRLFSQFAKLQNIMQAGTGTHQNILATAKTHLHAYLEFMTNLLKNMNADAIPAQMDKILQRAWQEEGWLRSLIESLETQQAAAPKNSKATAETVMTQGKASPTGLVPGLDKNAIAIQRDVLGLTSKETIAAAINQQTTQLLQPRSTTELLAMVQMHLGKNPLTPVAILMPFPMTFKANAAITDVTATQKEQKDRKRGMGQKLLRLGSVDSQVMCLVPAGPVILGDSFKEGREDELPCSTEQLPAFLLASTQVTNAQFAAWLNEQLELKTIEMPRPGCIYDLQGRLLARTVEATPMSQIETAIEDGNLYFRPQLYRENHPVVHVSYWGALAFCASHGVTLPTEAQWERAGGMLPTAYGQPIQKLRYGCRTDELTHAWANYFHHTHAKGPQKNRTVPVGFFDGERVLTLAANRIETMRAASPWGCFDMSGNVREWVAEDYDEEGHFQVTKGGSYADRPFDLRLAARIPLLAESTDPYTGFRVAFTLPEL